MMTPSQPPKRVAADLLLAFFWLSLGASLHRTPSISLCLLVAALVTGLLRTAIIWKAKPFDYCEKPVALTIMESDTEIRVFLNEDPKPTIVHPKKKSWNSPVPAHPRN